jgi:hypothetical protein
MMEKVCQQWPDADNATRSLSRILFGRNSATTTAGGLITVTDIDSKPSRKLRTDGKHGSMAAGRRSNERKQVRLWPGSWRACRLAFDGDSNRAKKFSKSIQPEEENASSLSTENSMKWVDPAVMSDGEIEAELSGVAVKLTQAREAGGKIGELEARQWRLRAEQTFRERRSDGSCKG